MPEFYLKWRTPNKFGHTSLYTFNKEFAFELFEAYKDLGITMEIDYV